MLGHNHGLKFPFNKKDLILKDRLEVEIIDQHPSQIVAISSDLSDLTMIQGFSDALQIPFKGYLFCPFPKFWNDAILKLELEFLDCLLTNKEAKNLLRGYEE